MEELLIKRLKKLLATIQIFHTNLHGFHWNIVSPDFFELHEELGDIYDCYSDRADVVAEFIRIKGDFPEPRFSRYLTQSVIEEAEMTTDRAQIIDNIINSLENLIKLENQVFKAAEADNCQAAMDLIAGFLVEDGKKLWMWKSSK